MRRISINVIFWIPQEHEANEGHTRDFLVADLDKSGRKEMEKVRDALKELGWEDYGPGDGVGFPISGGEFPGGNDGFGLAKNVKGDLSS